MARGIEIVVVLLSLYVMGAWIEMQFNPREWHLITRVVMVVFFNALVLLAIRGAASAKD